MLGMTVGHAVASPARSEGAVSLYSISVFLHVVGALGIFAGIALEQAGLRGLRRASTGAQVREWTTMLRALRRVEGPSALVVLATGLYLVATRWGRHAWIGLGLLGLVAMGALGGAVIGRRAKAIAQAVTDDGAIVPALRDRLRDPALRASASLRVALGLGIVFNMSVKPDTGGALAALGVALALGAAHAAWGGRRVAPAARYGTEH
jgi:hypothetical protein